MKVKVKKRTSYDGEILDPGEEFELGDEEAEDYPLKGMIEAGIVEVTKKKDENETAGMLVKSELTKIEGIGPSYAENICEEYGTEEELLEVDPKEIADSIHGITSETAERVQEEVR